MTSLAMGFYPPAVVRIACGSDRHAIRWDAGDLILLDHVDPEGERALAALGGTSYACVEILDAWERRRADSRLLSLLTRGLDDPVGSEAGMHGPGMHQRRSGASSVALNAVVSRGAAGWASYAPGMGIAANQAHFTQPGAQGESYENDVTALARLGRTFAVRLVATVTSHLLERMAVGDAEGAAAGPALEASLFGRSASAVRTWMGEPTVEVVVDVVNAGEEEITVTEDDGYVRLALPLDWVTEVWGRDLAVIGGRFALALDEATGRRATLQTVGSDFGPVRSLTVELG